MASDDIKSLQCLLLLIALVHGGGVAYDQCPCRAVITSITLNVNRLQHREMTQESADAGYRISTQHFHAFPCFRYVCAVLHGLLYIKERFHLFNHNAQGRNRHEWKMVYLLCNTALFRIYLCMTLVIVGRHVKEHTRAKWFTCYFVKSFDHHFIWTNTLQYVVFSIKKEKMMFSLQLHPENL